FFVIPGILWVLIFTIFPLLYSLRLSFFQARLGQDQTFIGMGNFQGAFSDYRFWNSLSITVFFVVVSVSLTVLLGLGLALLFNRPRRGLRFFRSSFVLPIFTAPIALGYLGLTIFHEDVGAVNVALRDFGAGCASRRVYNLLVGLLLFSSVFLSLLLVIFAEGMSFDCVAPLRCSHVFHGGNPGQYQHRVVFPLQNREGCSQRCRD